jgi:hypothetical protein
MKLIKLNLLIFTLSVIMFSCNNGDRNESIKSSTPENENLVSNQNNNNATDPVDISEGNNEYDPVVEVPRKKQIDWSDGKTYSYDYTETITKTDSLGNEEEITVYKQNKPSDADVFCNSKICKWCGKEVKAYNYIIEEYPNINWLRGEPDLSSIFGIISSIFDGIHYYDLDNRRVRTEWKTDCKYYGPGEFCSNRCEYEYRNR